MQEALTAINHFQTVLTEGKAQQVSLNQSWRVLGAYVKNNQKRVEACAERDTQITALLFNQIPSLQKISLVKRFSSGPYELLEVNGARLDFDDGTSGGIVNLTRYLTLNYYPLQAVKEEFKSWLIEAGISTQDYQLIIFILALFQSHQGFIRGTSTYHRPKINQG